MSAFQIRINLTISWPIKSRRSTKRRVTLDFHVTNVAISTLKNSTWNSTSKSSIRTFDTSVRSVQSLSTRQGVLWMYISKLNIEVKNTNAPNAELSMRTDMNMRVIQQHHNCTCDCVCLSTSMYAHVCISTCV